MREVHGVFGIIIGTWIWRTFVKSHNDIRTDTSLNIHSPFWTKKMFGAVDMRFKGHAFLGDFAVVC